MAAVAQAVLEAVVLLEGRSGKMLWTITAAAADPALTALPRFLDVSYAARAVSDAETSWMALEAALTGARGEARLCGALLFAVAGAPPLCLALVSAHVHAPSVLHALALAWLADLRARLAESPLARADVDAVAALVRAHVEAPARGLMSAALVPRHHAAFVALRVPVASAALPLLAHLHPPSSLVHVDWRASELCVLLGPAADAWALPVVDVALAAVVARVGVAAVAALLAALVAEARVVLVARSRRLLAAVVRALLALLHPLRWPHVVIPCLPASLLAFVQAPTPYLMGIVVDGEGEECATWAAVQRAIDAETLLCDLDASTPTLHRGATPLAPDAAPHAPPAAHDTLCTALSAALRRAHDAALTDAALDAAVAGTLAHDAALRFRLDAQSRANVAVQRAALRFWHAVIAPHRLLQCAPPAPGHVEHPFIHALTASTAWDEFQRTVRDEYAFLAAVHGASDAEEDVVARTRALRRTTHAASAPHTVLDAPPAALPPLLALLTCTDAAALDALFTAAVALPRGVVHVHVAALQDPRLLADALASTAAEEDAAVTCVRLALRLAALAAVPRVEEALQTLAALHALAPTWRAVHDAALWDALFAQWERALGPGAVRAALSAQPRVVRTQHAAYLVAKSSRTHAALQQRLHVEAAQRVQQRRALWLSTWLQREVRLAHVPTARELAALPWDALAALAVPSAWQGGDIAAAHVATWLVHHGLAPPETDGAAALLHLLHALAGDVHAPHVHAPPPSIPRTRLTQFAAAVRARVAMLRQRDVAGASPLDECVLRARVTVSGVRAEVALTAAALVVGAQRVPWHAVRAVEAAAVPVLFAALPGVRVSCDARDAPLTLCFAHERERTLALLCARELWLSAAVARDLEDATPLWRACVAVVLAQALSDLPTPASTPRHLRRPLSAHSLALRGAADVRLAQRVQQAGMLNRALTPPPPTAASEAESATSLVLTLLAQAHMLLSAHVHVATPTCTPRARDADDVTPLPRAHTLQHLSPRTRLRSGSDAPAPRRAPTSPRVMDAEAEADAAEAEDGAGVAWARLHASREYRAFVAATAALRACDINPARWSDAQRCAFLINLYNLMYLHGVFVACAVPASLLAWRLFARFVVYDVGGLPLSLDLVHRLVRGAGAQEGCVGDAHVAARDPRAAWLVTRRDPRTHLLLATWTRASPPLRLVTADNLDALLRAAAEDFCAAHVRLEGARLILPSLFAWYLPDFTTAPPRDAGAPHDARNDGGEGTLVALLQWLPAEQARALTRVVDDPHLELSFEHDWRPALAPAQTSH